MPGSHEDISPSHQWGSSRPISRPAPALWPDFMVGQKDNPTRVMLVDDDAHVRRLVEQDLLSDPRVLLVGQAASVREAKQVMRQTAFDVLLTDLKLEDGSGFDLLSLQRCLRPSAETIIISVMEGDDQLLRAIELGAAGYLVKHCWFGCYVQAVLQVANGGASITPHVARRLLQRMRGQGVDTAPLPTAPAAPQADLSQREREILRNVASGYTSQEIALQLKVTTQTVNTHVRNIYRKLQIKSRAQAVRAALLQGLL